MAALRSLRLTGEEEAWLRALLGGGPTGRGRTSLALGSDLWLRERSTLILIDEVLAHWRARALGRRYAFVTFIDDSGNTLMERPHLNRDAFRRKIDKAVRGSGLHAVVALEVQALTNYPKSGFGKTMMLHAHAIVWSDDPAWADNPAARYREWAIDLGLRDTWTCRFGAEPVLPEVIRDTEGDFAMVAAYISKVPSDGSRTVKNPATSARRMRSTTEDYHRDQALRIMEVLSQVELSKLIFAVGDGKQIAAPWRKAMLAVHRQRRRSLDRETTLVEIADGWSALRRHAGNRHHRASFRWLQSGERPASIHVGRNEITEAEVEAIRRRRRGELTAEMEADDRLDEF